MTTLASRFGLWSRSCLTMQGYGFLTDRERRAQWLGLRFSPVVCAVVMTVGVVLSEPIMLFALAGVALVGGFRAKHPFDYVYDATLRPLLAAPPLPPQPAPRRFACKLAAAWLVATGIAFELGPDIVGYALGAVLVAAGVVVSVTNWCLPSLIYAVGRRVAARGLAAPTRAA